MKRERLNKQITFQEARAVMRRAFEEDSELRKLYCTMVVEVIYKERVFAEESLESCERRAEKIMNKIFF